jgi:hypothetical protein
MDVLFPCVCCGFRTLTEPPNSHGICRFEPRGRLLAPWPEDRTVLYWWRRPGLTWWESVAPADSDNLSGMSLGFDHYLLRGLALRDVRVRTTGDPGRQLVADCAADRASSPRAVAERVVSTWMAGLRYEHGEAHLLRAGATSVQLDVVTRPDDVSYSITGQIIVRWA